MKLREFLNYRTHCIACGSELNTTFHSKKKQNHSILNDRLLIKIDLKSLKKGQKHYKVGYSIDCDNNDFCIEFFDQTGKQWHDKESSLFLIDRFKKLDKNHGSYSIIKYCNICNKYCYNSNLFDLDYKTANLGELSVRGEYGCFFKPYDDGYKAYKLHSFYDKEESTFDIIKISNECLQSLRHKNVDSQMGNSLIKTHVIKFGESQNEIIDKLNTLVIFS